MFSKKQGIVYSLLVAVLVLLLGLLAILGVNSNRADRFQNEINAIQHEVTAKDQQVKHLQKQLDDCDSVPIPAKPQSEINPSPADTSWTGWEKGR